jgi:hypothetical protein
MSKNVQCGQIITKFGKSGDLGKIKFYNAFDRLCICLVMAQMLLNQ